MKMWPLDYQTVKKKTYLPTYLWDNSDRSDSNDSSDSSDSNDSSDSGDQTNLHTKNLNLQGVFFFWPPLNLAMSQSHYKLLYLGNFRGGQFKLYRAWDLVKLGGGVAEKKTPCT